MRFHHALMGFAAVAVLLAGYLLIPRREEHVTMLARDGLYERAALELSAMREEGDQRPHILMQLHIIREKQGDHAGALTTLEAYVAAQPDDIPAREKFAELLLQHGRIDGHLAEMRRLAKASPRPDLLGRLLALYRLHGRFDEELTLLQDFADSKLLSRPHAVRLGALLAEKGQWDDAVRALQQADQGAPAEEVEARLMLFDALLQSGQVAAASRQAQAWLTTWRSPYFGGKLIVRMAQANLPGETTALARALVDLMPSAAFDLAGILTAKGLAGTSREILARWVERGIEPTSAQLRDYVYASMKAGDTQAPFLTLAMLARSGATPETLAKLAEELALGFGRASLSSLRPLLSAEVLLARPLFAAELAVSDGNPQLARWYLVQADPATMEPDQQPRWLQLLQRLEPPATVLARLTRLWQEKRLPATLVRSFAEQARDAGRPGLHDAIWASLRQ